MRIQPGGDIVRATFFTMVTAVALTMVGCGSEVEPSEHAEETDDPLEHLITTRTEELATPYSTAQGPLIHSPVVTVSSSSISLDGEVVLELTEDLGVSPDAMAGGTIEPLYEALRQASELAKEEGDPSQPISRSLSRKMEAIH